MNKKLTNIRAYEAEKIKLKDLSLELSAIQKNTVSTPEVIRRALNIPKIQDILKEDAQVKKSVLRGEK